MFNLKGYNKMRKKDRTQEFINFCEEHKRLPENNEQSCLRSWGISNRKSSPEVDAVYKKYSKKHREGVDRVQEFIDFCKEHGRLPLRNEQRSLSDWGKNHRKSSPEVDAMYKKYSRREKGAVLVDRTQEFIDFCKEHGRLPLDKEQSCLRSWGGNHRKSSPEVDAMYKKYSRKPQLNREQEFIDFCKEHGRLPRNMEQGGLKQWARKNKEKYPRVVEAFKEFSRGGGNGIKNRAQEIIDFHKRTGRLPRSHGGSVYEQGLGVWAKRHKDLYPELKELYTEADHRIPAEFIMPWIIAKAEFDLCAKYAFTTELKKEIEVEILKKDFYKTSEAETILKKFLNGLSRDPRWYNIPENRADLIASVMQKEKED